MNKLCIILLFLSAQLSAQNATEEIILIMDQQEKSWNSGDIPGFMSAYWKSDSLVFIGKSGPTYGWQKTLDNYLKAYPNKAAMGQLDFGLIKLEHTSEETAFMLGTWMLKREKDTLQGHFSLLWRKIEGQWKIVADHSSSS